VVSVATLVALGAAGFTGVAVDLMALTAANLAVTAGRFALLRAWVFRTEPGIGGEQ
jgi:hypothetical protein